MVDAPKVYRLHLNFYDTEGNKTGVVRYIDPKEFTASRYAELTAKLLIELDGFLSREKFIVDA